MGQKAVFMKIAIAIFAKTMGLSPVKTRLAADIDQTNAEAFYRLSVSCVQEVMEKVVEENPNIFPHWALAEEEAVELEQWKSFPGLWTGEGGLGTRLSNISSTLLNDYDIVFLMGTDSPQISPKRLLQITQMLEVNPEIEQVVGPASDGGFWLWGSKKPLPKSVWENVTYSVDTTLEELTAQALSHVDFVYKTYRMQDVDELDDLKMLQETLEHRGATLLPAQVKLLEWLQANNPTFQG
jgi:glycosyltransferase A (GT-A) superfamily protein (DUF2064 family)